MAQLLLARFISFTLNCRKTQKKYAKISFVNIIFAVLKAVAFIAGAILVYSFLPAFFIRVPTLRLESILDAEILNFSAYVLLAGDSIYYIARPTIIAYIRSVYVKEDLLVVNPKRKTQSEDIKYPAHSMARFSAPIKKCFERLYIVQGCLVQ